MGAVSVIFNDDVDEDLINLHHHRSPFRVVPELVRNYRIDAFIGGEWRSVKRVIDNRRRHRVHEVAGDMETKKLAGRSRTDARIEIGADCRRACLPGDVWLLRQLKVSADFL